MHAICFLLSLFSLPRLCPFLSMFIVRISPAQVRHADWLCCKKSLENTMDMKKCCPFSLRGFSKQAGHEHHLIRDISFAHTMHLTLSDHVHHFKTLQGAPRSLARKEAHPGLDQPFDEAMILLDEVIEVLPLPQFARAWHDPLRFQFPESFG